MRMNLLRRRFYMKKSIFTLLIVLLLIGGAVYGAFFGFGDTIQPVQKGVVLGLDLVGRKAFPERIFAKRWASPRQ